jgi:hypothetical protein
MISPSLPVKAGSIFRALIQGGAQRFWCQVDRLPLAFAQADMSIMDVQTW